jgi:hypothetical protein
MLKTTPIESRSFKPKGAAAMRRSTIVSSIGRAHLCRFAISSIKCGLRPVAGGSNGGTSESTG